MMKVSNRKAVRRLAWKSFQANRIRNLFAVIAMVLTSVLFTSLFTTAVGLNYTTQQQTMRTVGGYSHGCFKYLTKEQVEQLSDHPLVKEYGANLILSLLSEGDFAKHYTEIRYFDKNSAKMFYCNPTTGTLPENIYDFATDTAALKLLGIEPKLGEKVKITYPLGDKTVTDTFTLCGYWEADELKPVSEIAFSKEYVEEQLVGYQPIYEGDTVGTWDLEYMFKNSINIENNLRTIAKDNGYQIDDASKDNYLDIGVNWGYTSAQMNHDYTMLFGIIAIAVLILFAGYLIIYNIFLISVANDIRFYGLLKTIGTTGRQIKRIIRYQALLLSAIGIPIGLLLGYFTGTRITPIIMSSMTDSSTYMKADPIIFIGATLFTLLTVLISIRKPGKTAAKVSPIEAVRYTEGEANRKKTMKKSRHGARIHRMALSNLMRNKKKTIIALISLSLSIILLNSVYMFTKGFNTDKLISMFMSADFTIGSTNYFNSKFYNEEDAVSEDFIKEAINQKGMKGSGRVYYDINFALIDLTKEMVDTLYKEIPEKDVENNFFHFHGEDANDVNAQLYGMDDYILNKLEVVEGTLDIDKFKTGNYIVQVVDVDDYDDPFWETALYHPGDKVELDYIDQMDNSDYSKMKHHKKSYEVMAVVKADNGWNVRYSHLTTSMILPTNRFITDTGTNTMMSYLIDVDDKEEAAMEQFLKNYTEKVNPEMSYNSKLTWMKQFDKYKNGFVVIGNLLSFIIGLIGILNYVNVILTGIITRKREFSVLKSIGMTGKQLVRMLMLEGLIYVVATLFISAVCSTILNLTAIKALGNGIWFFTAHFTLLPIIIIAPFLLIFSIMVPYVAYQATNRESIVDQLRELE